jgi:predicted ATPase
MSDTRKPFYIKHAILEDYRSIVRAEVEFSPGLNIVIGKNGSGKTNLIRFLSPFVSGDFDNEVVLGNAKITFQGNSSSVMKMKSVDQRTSFSGLDLGIVGFFSLEIDNKHILPEITDDSFIESNDWLSVLQEIVEHENILLNSDVIYYGIPQKNGLWDLPFNSTIKLKNGQVTVNEQRRLIGFGLKDFSENSFTDAFSGLIKTESLPVEELEQHIRSYCSELCETLTNTTKLFSPVNNIKLSPDCSFKFDETTNEFSIHNLHFEFHSEGAWRKFAELSDGTKRILFILSELSLSGYRLKDEEYSGWHNITFLEEPEIGVHPHQLHTLVNFLKEESETKQIIITTHSPQVLDVIQPDELYRIIICEHHTEKGTQFRHMTEDEMNYAREYMKNQFLSDFWLHSGFNDDAD